jgi:RNA methyltransferase, TrmH family
MAVTAGFHSSHVRAARLLHTKKHRAQARCFLIEGPTLLVGALEAGVTPSALFYIPGRSSPVDAAVRRAQEAGVASFAVDERTLDSLAQTRAPAGVVAQVPFFDRGAQALRSLVPAAGPTCVLVLHDLDDPGNAGTLVRSAEAFGASAVCFGPESVEPYNDKLVRATMGALFRVPVVRYESWEALAAELAAGHLHALGAAADGPDIRSLTLPERSALVLGNERRGLDGLPPGAIELRAGIPQRPAVESLNVAVAGSILLYEIARCQELLRSPQ